MGNEADRGAGGIGLNAVPKLVGGFGCGLGGGDGGGGTAVSWTTVDVASSDVDEGTLGVVEGLDKVGTEDVEPSESKMVRLLLVTGARLDVAVPLRPDPPALRVTDR